MCIQTVSLNSLMFFDLAFLEDRGKMFTMLPELFPWHKLYVKKRVMLEVGGRKELCFWKLIDI